MRWFLVRLAIVNVLHQRLRATLTIGGIALSTCIMVLLFGLGGGLQKMAQDQINRTDLQNIVTVSSRNSQQLKLNNDAIAKIQSTSNVASIEQVVNLSGQVTHHDISLVIPIYGVTANYFKVAPANKTAGEIDNKLTGQAHNIILSEGALKAIGTDHSIVGQKVKLNLEISKDQASKQTEITKNVSATDFVVQGIVDKGASPVGYIPADFVFKEGVDSASQVKVELTYTEKMTEVRAGIEQMGFQTNSIKDAIAQVDRIFGIIQRVLIVFAMITVLVTVFGTINTITIELVEATKQIGFLRIMGIKREDVGKLFIMQSIIVSVTGATIGVVFGTIIGILSNGFIKALSGNDTINGQTGVYVYQIPTMSIIIILMLSILLGWAIGLFPARRAIKINPLEALKS